MPPAPAHRCRVLPSPWPGVYATEIDSGRHYGRHSHGCFGFGVLAHGAHRSSSDRAVVDAYAGDIVATNPGEMHDGRPLGGPSRRWSTVYVEPPVLASLAGVEGDIAIARPAFTDPELRHAVGALLASLAAWNGKRADALACEEALARACGLLLERHAARRVAVEAGAPGLERVRQRLADDLAHPPSLAELAALAGISRFQLLRRFAAQHGCTPHAWLLQQRAERVRHLVGSGTSLAEAAAACGFADQSHMTRIFTRQFGFTPGAWKAALQ
ncbi:MAG TPA: AraC family transcriptional regulator [Ramlibacter sp.]|jgi:AraC-like DNA-binding protein|nr:AraC family transcriptional regulator [Ramlibacter sp.]